MTALPNGDLFQALGQSFHRLRNHDRTQLHIKVERSSIIPMLSNFSVKGIIAFWVILPVQSMMVLFVLLGKLDEFCLEETP